MSFKKSLVSLANKYSNIKTIVLFGSFARQDNDKNSDIDIFILINDCSFDEYVKFKNTISKELGLPLSYISLYTPYGLSMLKSKGSYFLWHLKMEGILIYDQNGEYSKIFSKLKKYSAIKNDLLEYKEICNDILCNERHDIQDQEYDLSVLASLIRNTCIALSYWYGQYLFDRIKPVKYVKERIKHNFPFTIEEYEIIYKYRLRKNRQIDFELIELSDENVILWCEKALKLIDYGLHIIDIGGV